MLPVPPTVELKNRLKFFREILSEYKLSGALITDEQNVRYLSGFTGSDSALLVTATRRFILTDFRYIEEAGQTARGWKVVIKPQGLMEKAGVLAKKLRLRRLAVEPAHLRLIDLRALRKHARGVQLQPQEGLVGQLRLCKSDWEVRQIEKALRIQEAAFLEVCGELRAGLSEREAAALLRYKMVRAGADDEAFATMFQIDSHASLPHGRPSDRVLSGNNIVLVDWGARYAGYHSDLTRTFFLGSIPPRLQEIHAIVMQAQAKAIATVAPGVPMAEVDRAAREVIERAGFGKAFGHSTGHGLGLNIHEPPSLASRTKGALKAGMVITVEPGIYLPGVGGVRIEDDVLVRPGGYRVLSRLGKGLRWNADKD